MNNQKMEQFSQSQVYGPALMPLWWASAFLMPVLAYFFLGFAD